MAKFQKGQSGNPGGRPKSEVRIKELAREHTTAALNALVDVVQDSDAPPSARVAAASAILDRGYGKPSQHVEMDSNVTITNLHGWLASLGPVAAADLAMADQSGGVRDGDAGGHTGSMASGGTTSTRH